MTSQVLAIFYLNDMDHFIKENLGIQMFVRYQDDFLLFHESKQYLQYCFKEIKKFLEKEKLKINCKSRIFKCTNNFMFLGRNSKGRYIRYRNVKRKLKARLYLYKIKKMNLNSFASSLLCYENLLNTEGSRLIKN